MIYDSSKIWSTVLKSLGGSKIKGLENWCWPFQEDFKWERTRNAVCCLLQPPKADEHHLNAMYYGLLLNSTLQSDFKMSIGSLGQEKYGVLGSLTILEYWLLMSFGITNSLFPLYDSETSMRGFKKGKKICMCIT